MINRDSQVTDDNNRLSEPLIIKSIEAIHHGQSIQSESQRQFRPQQNINPIIEAEKTERFTTLDIYRGLTIVGMIAVDYADNKGLPFIIHSSWNGVTIADFVFPAFLFIMGTAVPLAINKNKPIRFKNILRIFMLFFIGFALNCIRQKFQFDQLRIPGILQRMSFCYAIILFIHWISDYASNIKIRRICALGITSLLLIYLSLMLSWQNLSIECPKANNLDPYCNFAGYVDRLFYGQAHILQKTDPQGLVSTLTAVFSTYMGYCIGLLMISFKDDSKNIIKCWLLVAFFNLLPVYPLSLMMPLCKKLYSISFLFLTTSVSVTVLTFSYILIELLPKNRPSTKSTIEAITKPLLWNGVNPLAIFIFMQLCSAVLKTYIIIDGQTLGTLLYEKALLSWLTPSLATTLYDIIFIIFFTAFAGILFRLKLFLRV